MFISLDFTYDSVSNEDMGVILISSSSGLKEQGFGIPRNSIKEKVKGRKRPFFYGFEEEVLKFQIEIMKTDTEESWTFAEKKNINTWLFKNTYCDFVSEDNLEILYKCVAVGTPKFYTSRDGTGYAQIDFECDAPYAWSASSVQTFDLSAIVTPTTIQIQNLSNVDDFYYPEVEFLLSGAATAFKLTNNTDGGRIFAFTGLTALETVYINNEKKQIISDLSLYRYSNLTNKQFFRLPYGTSSVVVEYACELTVRSQFPIII